ncbi:MAG: hypothetical protein FWG96_00040 [Methanomassiliicoccaceae archaeon]|nr:hypothetical protein [Methanomassiliicoccaceae archaeon]
MAKYALILKMLPYVLAAAVVILVLSASIPILRGGLDVTAEGDTDISVEGAFILAKGTYVIDSGLTYDVQDVTLRAYIVDDAFGSRVNILTLSGITIKANSVTEIKLESRTFIPSAYLILRDLVSRDGSEIPIRAEFSGKYIYGLIGMNVTVDTTIQLSEKGSKLEYDVRKDDTSLSLEIRNISPDIPVGDQSISVTGGGASVNLYVHREGNTVSAGASASGQFAGSLSKITGSFSGAPPEAIDDLTGDALQIDAENLKLLLDLLAYIWGEIE